MLASCLTAQPTSLTEAVDILFDALDDLDRRHLLEVGDVGLHFGLGMSIRNAWVHPEGSPLAEHFRETYGLGHPDDMSAIILKALVAKVRAAPFDPVPEAMRLRKFWADQGLDPLDGGRIDVPGDPLFSVDLTSAPKRRNFWDPRTWFAKKS